jgi:hypothetical protein
VTIAVIVAGILIIVLLAALAWWWIVDRRAQREHERSVRAWERSGGDFLGSMRGSGRHRH